MVFVTVLYPNPPGSRFDEEYYMQRHVPLLRQRWDGMGLSGAYVLRGAGTPDGGEAPFRLITTLTFDSAEAFQKAAAAHGEEIFADIPRFTDVQPVIQLNEKLG
jgi:uncharacterized protein (TIGR02118 family)